MKFDGRPEELRQAIAGAGLSAKIEEDDNHVRFRTADGGVCVWTRSTKNLVFQGKAEARQRLEAEVTKFVARRAERDAKAATRAVGTPPAAKKRKVFIVHGHDRVAREQLELVLHELGVRAIVGAKENSAGKTIIEHLESHIRPGSASSAHFGIALLTPDDMGHAKREGGHGTRPRARQNAILELGMLMGALGRKNVAMLVKGDLELPSDLGGVLRIDYQLHVREGVPKLAQHLKGAGFTITAEAISRAASRQ